MPGGACHLYLRNTPCARLPAVAQVLESALKAPSLGARLPQGLIALLGHELEDFKERLNTFASVT